MRVLLTISALAILLCFCSSCGSTGVTLQVWNEDLSSKHMYELSPAGLQLLQSVIESKPDETVYSREGLDPGCTVLLNEKIYGIEQDRVILFNLGSAKIWRRHGIRKYLIRDAKLLPGPKRVLFRNGRQ